MRRRRAVWQWQRVVLKLAFQSELLLEQIGAREVELLAPQDGARCIAVELTQYLCALLTPYMRSRM